MVPNQWLPEDKDQVYFTKHTNALAVAYGIAPSDWRKGIIQQIMRDDFAHCPALFHAFCL